MSNLPQGKVALVTGTSTGMGLSASVQLAQSGFTVIATMRDLAKAGELRKQAKTAGVTIEIRHLDVQDDTSIAGCVHAIMQSYGRIDLLVNNAGAGYLDSMEQTSLPHLRHTMDVNFFGVWRVTQAVFPIMRAARSGHIITVTSLGGIVGQPFFDAYCAAKFAVEGFLECLAPVAKLLGVTISLVEPGPVFTNWFSSVMETHPESPPELQAIYGPMLESYVRGLQEIFDAQGQTADEAAQVIVRAATAESPHFRYQTSKLVQDLLSQKYATPGGDNAIAFFAERLASWVKSEQPLS